MSRKFRFLRVERYDIEIFAACLAGLAYQMDDEIDEAEAFELARDHLNKNGGDLSFMDAVEIGVKFKTTKANPGTIWN